MLVRIYIFVSIIVKEFFFLFGKNNFFLEKIKNKFEI